MFGYVSKFYGRFDSLSMYKVVLKAKLLKFNNKIRDVQILQKTLINEWKVHYCDVKFGVKW